MLTRCYKMLQDLQDVYTTYIDSLCLLKSNCYIDQFIKSKYLNYTASKVSWLFFDPLKNNAVSMAFISHFKFNVLNGLKIHYKKSKETD